MKVPPTGVGKAVLTPSDAAMEPEEGIRAFIALELPEHIVGVLERLQAGMRSLGLVARWVRPENLHVTLKFLGQTLMPQAEAVGKCLPQVVTGSGPLSLRAKGVGVFPGIRRPRVIWVGLADLEGGLLRLHRKLEEHLAPLGFSEENRPFRGHLTLGRFKGDPQGRILANVLEAFREFETESFFLESLILFRSDLTPKGPVYSKFVGLTL